MRKSMAFAFLLCAVSATAATKPVASLPAPCKSGYQALSPDGKQLAWRCRDSSIHVVSIPEGKELMVIPAEQHASSLVYSRDGQWLAVGFHDGTVKVFGSNSSSPVGAWKTGGRRLDLLYFFPDGKTLVVAPADVSAQVWQIGETPKLMATLPFEFGGLNACAASPDGKTLVIAGDDTILRWYDTATWKKTLENRSFLLETFALAFTPDGKQVLAGGADGRITVLDAATAQPVRQLPPENGAYVVEIDLLNNAQTAAAMYLDDAGGKPPHGRLWNLVGADSVALSSEASPSCGNVVEGKLWVCGAEGSALKITQYE